MKNARTGLTAVVLGIAFAATSFAVTATSGATAATAARPLHVAGKISAVDANARSLKLIVEGKTEEIAFTTSTAILEDGKTVAASALAAGEKVKVAFESQAGRNVASSIEILKTAAPASATKSK